MKQCLGSWTNVKSTRTWDAESHPKFAIVLKYTVSGVTFDEELLCAIGISYALRFKSYVDWRGWRSILKVWFWKNQMSVTKTNTIECFSTSNYPLLLIFSQIWDETVPKCHTNVKTTRTCNRIEIYCFWCNFWRGIAQCNRNFIRPSVQELHRWAWLKVNTEGVVLEKSNVCYKN